MEFRTLPRILALSVAGICANAQSPNATLVGEVVDTSGAPVAGATLEVRNQNSNEVHRGASDEKGEFTIPNLAPGPYDVAITREGFRATRQTNLVLEMEQVARLKFRLELGEVSQSVVVKATAAPLINTENGTKGEVVVTEQIVEMPLNGRDFSDLALLVPGVSPNAKGGMGSGFAINGARADNTNFIIDGFNDQNPRGGSAQARPNIDALQEFKMETSNYSAEYGRLAGGVMNMVLKSGGNQFHGVLFEFVRNDFFDTRNFFDANKGELRQNQFGGTLGGPIHIPRLYNGHDRSFFLFSWESFRQLQGASKLGVVPSAAMRSGDFSQVGPIADPLSSGSCPGSTATKGACFPGNQIPFSRLNPQALAAEAFYPLPNQPGQVNNYLSYVVAPDNWDSWLMKFDHRLTVKDSLSFRYMKRYTRSANPYANPNTKDSNNTGLFGQNVISHQTLTGITYTRMFTPAVINEARMGVSRTVEHDIGFYQGVNYNALFGISGTTTDPALIGFPLFAISGMQQLGGGANLPVTFFVTNFSPSDTLTWVKGAHMIKAGGDILHTQFTQPYWNNNRGTFNFTGSWTGQPYADFMSGLMNSDSRQIGTTTNYLLSTSYGFFVQDDWKANSRLTLNLGLRYEIPKQPVDKYGRLTNFVPALQQLAIASESTLAGGGITFSNPNEVTTATQAGLPPSLVYTRYTDFAPRFGFALRPFGGSQTVLRGGYGIFYGSQVQNPVRNNLANAFPFAISQTINRNTADPLFLTLSNPFPNNPNLSGNLSSLTVDGYELHAPSPYLQSWNFTLEREIGLSSALEVSYVGSKGTHLGIQVNINQPYRLAQYAGTFPVPYAGFGTINYFSFEGNSIYNAGMITLRRRFAHGFFYTFNYTYSKSIDDASQLNGSSTGGYSGLQDARNLRGDRGRSDWDIGHQFTMAFSWLLPFQRNVLVRGWQIAGTGRLYTGAPFTPIVSNVNLNLGEANRPNRLAKGPVPNPDVNVWYNVADFPQVPQGAFTFGDSGRGILDGPGLIEMNLTLFKNFAVKEKQNLQLRWEVFNVLNHPNLGLPVNTVNAPNAGTITTADNGRLMQFGVRYEF